MGIHNHSRTLFETHICKVSVVIMTPQSLPSSGVWSSPTKLARECTLETYEVVTISDHDDVEDDDEQLLLFFGRSLTAFFRLSIEGSHATPLR